MWPDIRERIFSLWGANFGVLPPLREQIRDKRERYMALSVRALTDLKSTVKNGRRCIAKREPD